MTIDIDSLKQAPETLIRLTVTEKFSFDRDTLEDIQVSALKRRFADLLPKVSVLRRFAEEQKVDNIRTLEDGALLLLPHTFYKSYPLSAIEKNRYDQMTRWLATLTAVDLGAVDTAGCETIDDWIERLDAQTALKMRHSSGTTGKLSFVPITSSELGLSAWGLKRSFEGFGDEPDAHVDSYGALPVVAFGYRHGSQSFPRTLQAVIDTFYGGDDSEILCLSPGSVSADLASLAGRLEGARNRGALGTAAISPGLQARREQLLREQAEAPRHLERFFDTIANRYRGQKVILQGVLPPVVHTALNGLERGLEGLFDPASPFSVSGGAKGQNLPEDYKTLVTRFTGVAFPSPGFGMSEATSAITRMCPEGHYHIVPNLIPYLLDPDTGALLPRKGRRTGRLGIIDLGASTRWGGFLTGDEVTLNFGDEAPCRCGRKGAHISADIRRYSELRGGDDKITCAGAPGLADRALDFIAGASA